MAIQRKKEEEGDIHGKYMGMQGNTGEYMAIHGNTGECMGIHENT